MLTADNIESRFVDSIESRFVDKIVKEPALIMYRRYLIVRIYVVMSIFISVVTMLFDPSSVYGKAAIITDAPLIMLFSFLAITVIAIIDILINDIAPDKFVFKMAYNYRHITYMIMAIISFAISISIIESLGVFMILGRLWLDGCVAAVVAFLDIFTRHRGTFSGSKVRVHNN